MILTKSKIYEIRLFDFKLSDIQKYYSSYILRDHTITENYMKLFYYLASKESSSYWSFILNTILYVASKSDCKKVIEFAIDRGGRDYNSGLYYSILGNKIVLMDYFISLGANHWCKALQSASSIGIMNLVQFYISKGADNWYSVKEFARQDGHKKLEKYFCKLEKMKNF